MQVLQGGDQVQIDAVLRGFEVPATLITTTPNHFSLQWAPTCRRRRIESRFRFPWICYDH